MVAIAWDVTAPALTGPLIGRAEECAVLDTALAGALEGRAVTVAVTGDAGAGKTALCRYLACRAEHHGARVLSTTCVEGEADLALAGLSALLRPVAVLAAGLPPRQRDAVQAACGLLDGAGTDRFALGAATLGVLAAAAEERPLVVVVDDIQWLDGASRDALSFAVRRLGADSVLVLVAARAGRGEPSLDSVARPLPVAGLGVADLASMLESAGIALHGDVARAVHAATDGLPLPALETAAALSPEQRAGADLLPDPLPVGRAVVERYRARLDELSEPTRRALTVVAAAGSAPAGVLHRALATLHLDISDLDGAEDAGLVTLSEGRAHLTHPLLRAAAYAHAATSTRRTIHAALADASVDDPERHARHLAAAATGPGDELATALMAGAEQARARAGLAAAAPLLWRAAEATPPGAQRDERLLDAAKALSAAGRREDAERVARDLAATAADPGVRADATLVLLASSVWGADSPQMRRTAVAEAHQIAATDPARASRALFCASTAATGHGALQDALDLAERAHELAGSVDDPVLVAAAREQYAMDLVLLGRHREALALLEGPRPVATDTSDVPALQRPATLQTLVRLARMREADELADELLAVCAHGEAPSAKVFVLAVAGECRSWQGRWAEAVAAWEEATTLANQTGQDVLGWFTAVSGARTLAALGRDEAARTAVAEVLSTTGTGAFPPLWVYGPASLGFLELGRGRHAAAVAHLRTAEAARRETGLRDPRTVPFGPDLVEALVRSGERDEARDALEDLATRVSAARTSWGLAVTARCRALLDEDPDRADVLYSRALNHHREDGSPFDLARTQLCRGEQRRRCGDVRKARPVLRDALDGFRSLGAEPWAVRAAAELRAAGGEPLLTVGPGPVDALSPQELQCALAVARGMRNREAAAALFISPKTVEYHLRKAYAKLGVSSRAQLVRLLAGSEDVATR